MAGDLRERQKAEGKRQNVTVRPSGAGTQSYGYDTARRLQTLGSPAGTFNYTFNGPGNTWTNLALPPSGSHIARDLDNVARLASSKLLNSGGGTLNSHAYLYSLANQRTRQTRTDSSYVNYGYDPNGQLQSAVGTWGQSTENLGYRYDGGWNLITRTNNGVPTTFAVVYQNQLTAGPEAPYSYDANGNLIGKGSMTFQYDGENRLITVTQPGVFQSQFAYDAIGRLRIRWESAWAGYYWNGVSTTVYIYDGMQVIQERDNTGTPLVAYTRGSDLGGGVGSAGGIGGLLARSIGYSGGTWSTHHYYHADAGGNVTYLMDSSQGLAASYIHGPFGDLRGTSGPYANGNLFRFSSKHFHTNSALHYYGFRFYDANSQRWLNRDPVGESGSINLYRFGLNSPMNLLDALGLEPWLDEQYFRDFKWFVDDNVLDNFRDNLANCKRQMDIILHVYDVLHEYLDGELGLTGSALQDALQRLRDYVDPPNGRLLEDWRRWDCNRFRRWGPGDDDEPPTGPPTTPVPVWGGRERLAPEERRTPVRQPVLVPVQVPVRTGPYPNRGLFVNPGIVAGGTLAIGTAAVGGALIATRGSVLVTTPVRAIAPAIVPVLVRAP